MKEWLHQQWKPACRGGMLLLLDVHRAQKTAAVKQSFAECNTTPVYVPPGTTGLVQPLDVVFNAPFKEVVSCLSNQHMHDNLEAYVHGSIPATDRRLLFTKWVGQAWEETAAKHAMVVRAFRKCGISLPIDGSQDSEINIKELNHYTVNEETDLDDDDDPFADL